MATICRLDDALWEEASSPDNAFPIENSGIAESERSAQESAAPLPIEEPGTEASFPLENETIVGEDVNLRKSLPVENSGITIADSPGIA